MGATAYQKPSSGIGESDLSNSVNMSLDLADTAVQASVIGELYPEINPGEYATTEEVNSAINATKAEFSQLQQKVSDISTGKYYGYYASANDLPDDVDVDGFAYVGTGPTYTIYNCQSGAWTSSGLTVNQSPIGNDDDINQDTSGKLQFADRVYNAQQPDGMGYVILRKNKTFASQVTAANTIYEIRYDFDLDNASVTIPAGCVLKFNGGKVTNGYLQGKLANDEIYLSWFNGSVAALSKLDLSNSTVIFDINVVFDGTFVLKDVSHLKIEGNKKTITRASGSFFLCQGVVNDIEVCNFRCNGNLNGDFFAMSTNTVSSNINVHDNHIETIRTGISFNAHNRNENENGSCENCIAENNTVIGNHISNSVQYYGIHLANANNCVVRGNVIKRVGRHSIYHAYGHYNEISENTIEENGYGIDTAHYPALNIIRDSKHIIVRNNVFRNNNGPDVQIMGAAYDSDVTLPLDTNVNGVNVYGNSFYHSVQMSWPGKYNIVVGRPSDNYNTENVVIAENTFVKSSVSGKYAVHIETVKNVNILKNDFYLNDSSAIIIDFAATLDPAKSSVFVRENRFYSSGQLSNYVYLFPEDSAITVADFYACIHIKENEYCGRRGASGVNYALYPSHTLSNLKNYANLEMGAIVRFETTNFYADNFVPNTGYYNVVGDILLVFNQYGTTSTSRNVMGFVCAAAGNPGTWRPFGFNAMNFDTFTTGEGYPSGSWNGRMYQAKSILAVAFGNNWYRGDGYAAMNKEGTRLLVNNGTTDNRPSLNGGYDPLYLGFRYYDRTIGKVLHWCHDRWEEADGALAGVSRSGPTTSRPAASAIYDGFVFFDTTLGKPVYWNGSDWVDAIGTVV
ncbi:MAG: right-handed parallel beta-helix repeat-containing protein [Methanobrevibacter sp.]|nr:right-handed parallel beta-helix repeat-containing protein [Methanobrevibacter sp.]